MSQIWTRLLLFMFIASVINIAKTKLVAATAATQESTYQHYTANNCIDGDLNTLCHTNHGTNVWFKMTLNETSCIDSVRIVCHKTDGEQFRMDKGEITVLNSGAGKESMCGVLRVREGSDQTYNIKCEKYACGDQVKLSVSQSLPERPPIISMKEMTAYYSTDPCPAGDFTTTIGCQQCKKNTFSLAAAPSCTDCPESKVSAPGSPSAEYCHYEGYGNIAKNAGKATQSTELSSAFAADKAIDGIIDTVNGISQTQSVVDQWWKVEFSAAYFIDTVKVHGQTINGVSVFVGEKKVGTVESDQTVNQEYIFSGNDHVSMLVKIVREQGSEPIVLAEVEVFGILFSSKTKSRNMAREGTASQIDDWGSGDQIWGPANKAIDGNFNGVWEASPTNSLTCTYTKGPTAWWKVDLHHLHLIHNILIYNRMVQYQSRIDGGTVHIDEYQVITLEYMEDRNPFIADNLYRIGSEVRIQGGSGSEAYLNLAEVQIYADRLQKIPAESATQKDTYTDSSLSTFTADKCIDGVVIPSNSSVCHTLSAPSGEEAWFQMEFSETRCFHVIQIAQQRTGSKKMRMNNAKIHVIDKITGKDILCGTLSIREESTVQGQIYAIECGQMSCGNLIKVSVLHQSTETPATIHMREITAFVTTDCKRLPWKLMKTDSALPVTADTVLNLSCEDPYEIEGARQVTCNPGKPYSYGGDGQEPSCSTDWKTTKLQESISFDIDTTPLRFRTLADKDDSQIWIQFMGVSEMLSLSFRFDEFSVWLKPDCNTAYGVEGFTMTNVPTQSIREWTIFKTATRLSITCNEVDVWSKEFRSISDECQSAFARDTSSVLFKEAPTPSIYYKAAGCMALPWSHMKSDPVVPVPKGTTLTLSCGGRHVLEGTKHVTCNSGLDFSYDQKPFCKKIGTYYCS